MCVCVCARAWVCTQGAVCDGSCLRRAGCAEAEGSAGVRLGVSTSAGCCVVVAAGWTGGVL